MENKNKMCVPGISSMYVMETGISGLTSTKGNLGAQIWQQEEGDNTHIIVLSWWESYESIKAFAGEDISTARYYEKIKSICWNWNRRCSIMNAMISANHTLSLPHNIPPEIPGSFPGTPKMNVVDRYWLSNSH